MKKTLSPSQLYQINKLFLEKKWDIDEDSETSLFRRFIDMISFFENDEQDVLIKLSYEFLSIPTKTYFDEMDMLIKKIISTVNQFKSIIFLPIIKEYSDGNLKIISSGAFIGYMIKAKEYRYNNLFGDRKIIIKENINKLEDSIKQDTAVVLIDDIIGSGDSASKTIEKIKHLVSESQLYIGSIVCAKIGENKIHDDFSINCIYNYSIDGMDVILPKIAKGEQEEEKRIRKILEGINAKLDLSEAEGFGYNGTGLLVAMLRTPNNTLPVFRNAKKAYPAAFPRW